jgi:hypothetical protein
MSSPKKTLVVFGGTGLQVLPSHSSQPSPQLTQPQGGSVARYFLQTPNSPYRVRVVTRDPSSSKSQALASLGAEVVRGHLDDADSLASAIKDAHAVFLITDFFSNLEDPGNEIVQGKRAVDIAAQSPTLEHLIWSCLPSAKDASKGKYDAIIHFDGKALVTEYIETQHKALWAKTTVLWLGPYMQLWLQMPALFGPKKVVEDGKEIYTSISNASPDTVLPYVDVDKDTGKTVNAILTKSPSELGGKTVTLVASMERTHKQHLEIWGQILGKNVSARQRSDDEQFEFLGSLGLPEFMKMDMVQVLPAFQYFVKEMLLGNQAILASEVSRNLYRCAFINHADE